MENSKVFLLWILIFCSCSSKEETRAGRYVPLGNHDVLDTENGTIYNHNKIIEKSFQDFTRGIEIKKIDGTVIRIQYKYVPYKK
jgi:hypothetical protein